MSFGHIIYPCERTADVLVVPVVPAISFPDVKDEEMHLVYVLVHPDGFVFFRIRKDREKDRNAEGGGMFFPLQMGRNADKVRLFDVRVSFCGRRNA